MNAVVNGVVIKYEMKDQNNNADSPNIHQTIIDYASTSIQNLWQCETAYQNASHLMCFI